LKLSLLNPLAMTCRHTTRTGESIVTSKPIAALQITAMVAGGGSTPWLLCQKVLHTNILRPPIKRARRRLPLSKSQRC
jgi:hypothetical protein